MLRQSAIATLREDGWLSGQPVEFQEELLRHAELRSYPKHATIQVAGDDAAGLFGLATGELSVVSAPRLLPHLLVQVAQPGWWFGDVALISDAGRIVTITARAPVSILVVKKAGILRLADQDSSTWRRIAQITVMHLDQALRIIGAMSIASAQLRVAFALARLTENHPADRELPVEIQVTHADLGEMTRMTRNAVMPVLQAMQTKGIVELSYRKVVVLSIARLWQFIEQEAEIGRRVGG